MAEIRTLVDAQEFSYEGLMDLKALYRLIDEWCEEHSYDKVETENQEVIHEDGRDIMITYKPYRKYTEYCKFRMKLEIDCYRIKDVEIEKNGVKQTLQKGKVVFTCWDYLITDYENLWETKAFYFFMRTLVDKFIYKLYTSRFGAEAKKDYFELVDVIKSFLNMTRFKQ